MPTTTKGVKSPTGRTSKVERKPQDIGQGKQAREKKEGQAMGNTIAQEMRAKRETLLRMKDLDQFLDRRNLGLEPTGDMRAFIKDLVKKLKQQGKS